jgi:hypothetical protein
MTELEEIGAQLKLLEGRKSLSFQEYAQLTGLYVEALMIRVEELESRVSNLKQAFINYTGT